MTKEDIADILLCIGNALRGFRSEHITGNTTEPELVIETGTIESAEIKVQEPEAPQPIIEAKPLTIEVPDMSAKIKEIFDNQNLDPHLLAMRAKEREIQLLKEQLQNLQQSNKQLTGNIG